jgi:hypothetical protein
VYCNTKPPLVECCTSHDVSPPPLPEQGMRDPQACSNAQALHHHVPLTHEVLQVILHDL